MVTNDSWKLYRWDPLGSAPFALDCWELVVCVGRWETEPVEVQR